MLKGTAVSLGLFSLCVMDTGTHPLSAVPHPNTPTFIFPASTLQYLDNSFLLKAIQGFLCCHHNSEFYIKLIRITVLASYDCLSTYD